MESLECRRDTLIISVTMDDKRVTNAQRRNWTIWSLVLLFPISCSCLAGAWVFVRPAWLTRAHGAEMAQAVERYYRLSNSIEGWTDPNVISQFATGDLVEELIQHRCQDCPAVQVLTGVQVQDILVFDYSDTTSRVQYRVEWGWRLVDTKSHKPVGRCYAEAENGTTSFRREEGIWKVSAGGGERDWLLNFPQWLRDLANGGDELSSRQLVGNTPELLAKYCPPN